MLLHTNYFFFLDYKRYPLNAVQYDRRSGDLVWKADTFRRFPVHGVNDFKTLRERPKLCFFDKTAFILALESFGESVLDNTIMPVLVVVVGSRHVLLWNLDGNMLDGSA